jgi:hypothetical protein
MDTYKIRVRLANGMVTEVQVSAQSATLARQMVESQYGAGSFLGHL